MKAAGAGNRVAFVIPHPYIDALSCFREPIAWLADRGWRVDLYTVMSPRHPVPFFDRDAVEIRPMRMSRGGAVELVRQLVAARPKYRTIVTVPQWGLHYAGLAARLAGVPLGCISDELKSDAEASDDRLKLWRTRERKAHQQCAWTIALSEERADFIRRENRLPDAHPVFVVPNAPQGPAARIRSRYFHDVLGLSCDARILLHAGSLWWSGARDVMQRAREWTGARTVVFQSRLTSGEVDPGGGHVRVAPDVLPAALLDYAISSASIGLALYDERTINNRLMGTASGKVARYLKNLLPVIATRAGGFDWIAREGCGVCIDDISEIPAAAARIESDYERYVANAERWFNTALDFGARFGPVADLIARS